MLQCCSFRNVYACLPLMCRRRLCFVFSFRRLVFGVWRFAALASQSCLFDSDSLLPAALVPSTPCPVIKQAPLARHTRNGPNFLNTSLTSHQPFLPSTTLHSGFGLSRSRRACLPVVAPMTQQRRLYYYQLLAGPLRSPIIPTGHNSATRSSCQIALRVA